VADRDFVQSLERGLAVIQAFSDERPALTAVRIAELTNLSRAACRRFLVTLERLGYVSRDQSGLYRLTPAVLRLGYAYLSSQDLPQIVRPHCQALAGEHRVSSSFGVLEGADLVFLVRALPPGYLATRFGVGSRLPAWSCAMGRVVLGGLSDAELQAHLASAQLAPFTPKTVTDPAALTELIGQVRSQGYCLLDQEVDLGVRALALPIQSRPGKLEGSICIGVYDTRVSPQEVISRHLRPLQEAATAINKSLALLS
jgi:IclR family pca regulon transcriptional regulator